MSETLDNIYIDRFLLLAFVKYILSQIYSHCTQRLYLLILSGDCGNFWFFEENILKNYCHNSGVVSNVLSIGLQYTLSFK